MHIFTAGRACRYRSVDVVMLGQIADAEPNIVWYKSNLRRFFLTKNTFCWWCNCVFLRHLSFLLDRCISSFDDGFFDNRFWSKRAMFDTASTYSYCLVYINCYLKESHNNIMTSCQWTLDICRSLKTVENPSTVKTSSEEEY